MTSGSTKTMGRFAVARYLTLGSACLFLLGLLVPARLAVAHPRVVATDPLADGRVASGPREIRIQFDQALARGGAQVQVFDRERRSIPVQLTEVAAGGTVLRARLDRLPQGPYTVLWRALSAVDGHTLRGSFSFAVGPAGAERTPAQAAAVEGWEVWLSQILPTGAGWIHLSGLIAVAGLLLFWLVIGSPPEKATPPSQAGGAVRRILLLSLWGGLLQIALELLNLAGSVRELVAEPGTAWMFLSTPRGLRAVARLFLLYASLSLLRDWEGAPRAAWRLWLIIGLQAVSFWTVTLASHTAAASEGAGLPVLGDWLHLLAATVWAGGLVALWHHAWTTKTSDANHLTVLMARFAPWAAGAFAVLVATGSYTVSRLAPEWWKLPSSGYGRILLAKLALVAAMLALGMRNSLACHPGWTARIGRFFPLLNRLQKRAQRASETSPRATGRWITAEVTVGVAILGLAVLLSRTPPPRSALPPPAPPLTLAGPAGDLRLTLTITTAAGWIAPSRFRLQFQGRDGPPRGVTGVTLRLDMPEMAMPLRPIVAEPVGPGEYEAEAFLGMLGRWQAQVSVRRPGRKEVRTVFEFGVGERGPTADVFSLGHTRADLGYHWSTLFLMAMPYVIVGSIGGWLFYLHRRAERQRRE